jgi:hypothetical protein
MDSQGRIEKQMVENGEELRDMRLTISSTLTQMMVGTSKVEGSVLNIY